MRNLAEHRRETAEKELGSTLANRKVCIVSLIVFSMVTLSVPVCQLISEFRRGEFLLIIHTYELFSHPKREAFDKYEDTVTEESVFMHWLLPNMQTILTGFLRIGNEQAYTGRDGCR